MGTGIDSTPEVQFGVLIADGIFGHSLMEGAITIQDDDLGPAGKDILGGIVGKNAFSLGLILGPKGRTTVHALAALIAILQCLFEVLPRTISSALEEEEDVFGITLMQIDGGCGPINALGLGVAIMDYLFVGRFL